MTKMARQIGVPVLGVLTMLFVGCYGDHDDSVITCSQEQIGLNVNVVGSGGGGSSTYWICEASWIDPETNVIHDHQISNEYQGEYRGCKDRGKQLTADITIEIEHTDAGPVQELVVSNVRCI